MAARLVDDAGEIQAMRQRLQQAVTVSDWSDAVIWKRLALKVGRELPDVEVTDFREALAERGYSYMVGVPGAVVVWTPGTRPIPPSEQPPTRFRPRTRFQTGDQKPVGVP